MRAALQALTEELKRLKATGVREVSVSDESLSALRVAIAKRAKTRGQNASVPGVAVEESSSNVSSPKLSSVPSADLEKPEVRVTAPKVSAKKEPSPFPSAPVVKLPAGDKQTRWDALNALIAEDPICRARVRPGKKIVVGVGSLDAKIFFCGEAPGADEEEQGEPFVGPAGQLLTKMIQAMGLSRQQVYIGNIMNWRPDMPLDADGVQVGNRPPTQDEMTYCLPYLKAQLEVVNPDYIVALGSTAAQALLGFGTFKTLGEIRGQWKLFDGKPVMVTYHPSYILRNPTNRSKRAIWEDFLKVMERAALPISEKQRGYFLEK